jgi:hypothetical protein
MALLNQWIDNKLAQVATSLPSSIHQDPASFSCGYNVGYKSALLDLEKELERLLDSADGYPPAFTQIYQSQSEMESF